MLWQDRSLPRDCRVKRHNKSSDDEQSNVAFHAGEATSSGAWVIDSDMCKDREAFVEYKAAENLQSIFSAKRSAS